MKTRFVIPIAILIVASGAVSAQQQQPPPEYAGIKNFLRVNQQICTGGQPTMDDLVKMKAEGVKAIINLRQPAEYNAEEEAAKAKELGLRCFNIPVTMDDLN